ncbi:MAG: hypothetical protein BMS9Abin20_0367 [Acidimicrobiia bacterium]|nr:MAG: hypothetical protein BMS9Abin20_0367 [Acidimicrobiia bacterium]
MTERVETYDVSEHPGIDISLIAGDVIVKSWNENRIMIVLSGHPETVESTTIDATQDSVAIRSNADKRSRRFFARAMDVVVTTPPGGIVRINSGSGDVRVRLRVAEVEVNSASGDVHIEEEVGHVRVKVASGRVTVAYVEGDAEVSSANGDIKIGHAADAVVTTASGTIVLGTIESSARVKSASGDVRVRDFRGSDLVVKTMSGDAILGLAPGRTVNARITTLSGDFRNKIKPTDGDKTVRMTLIVKSFSGDVILRSAG